MMRALFLVMLVYAVCPSAQAAGGVSHNPQVQIDRDAIRLGDVFAGLPADKDMDIATAPAAGRSVTYDYSVLSKLAQRYQLAWQAESYNDKSIITRAANHITATMVRTAVVAQLRDQGVQGDIDVLLDQRMLEINLPTSVAAAFTLHDFSFDKGSQRFQAVLQAAVDTPAFQQLTLSGRVTNVVTVPVLNKALAAGAVIGKGDLDWIKLPADRASDYLRTAEGLVGMELRRQMAEQSGLKPQDVLPPRVVLKGTLVTMQVEMPGVMLTAQGRALQDGAVGEVIRVTNTQSNRVVEAKIVAPGIVRITLNPQLASLP